MKCIGRLGFLLSLSLLSSRAFAADADLFRNIEEWTKAPISGPIDSTKAESERRALEPRVATVKERLGRISASGKGDPRYKQGLDWIARAEARVAALSAEAKKADSQKVDQRFAAIEAKTQKIQLGEKATPANAKGRIDTLDALMRDVERELFPLDTKHPSHVKLKTWLASAAKAKADAKKVLQDAEDAHYKEGVAQAEQAKANAQAQQGLQESWQGMMKEQKGCFEFLQEEWNDVKYAATKGAACLEPAATVAKRCKAEFAALKGYYVQERDKICAQANTWPKLAFERNDKAVRSRRKELLARYENLIEELKRGAQVKAEEMAYLQHPDVDATGVLASFKRAYEAVGASMPADITFHVGDPATTAAAIKASQVAFAAENNKAPFVDGTVTGIIKADFAASNLPISRVGQLLAAPEIVKDSDGIITKRIRTSLALVKVSGESYCRAYFPTVEWIHVGFGKFDPPRLDTLPRETFFHVAYCK